MKKLIINEKQLNSLVNNLTENLGHEHKIKNVFNFLENNYQPTKGTYKKGGEFHERIMIVNKTNEELLTLKSLLKYIEYKFENYSREFIKQVITDWISGFIKKDNYILSKNVSS